MYRCLRLRSTVQNRAILRYALFVVWKLYTCRFATQQTEHFWTALRCPTHLFVSAKITACVPLGLLCFYKICTCRLCEEQRDEAIQQFAPFRHVSLPDLIGQSFEQILWYGLLLSHEVREPQNMVYFFRMKWINHKMWFIASTWSEQTTKCGLLLPLEASKPHNAVCYFHLKWANHKIWFVSFTWSEQTAKCRFCLFSLLSVCWNLRLKDELKSGYLYRV